MPGLYGVSDIVVGAMSKSRVFGMTALESMVCGRLTINTWSRRHYGDTGFPEIEYGVKYLARLLERLIEDESLRRRMANAQREWVSTNHGSKTVASKLLGLYKYILSTA